MNRVPLKRLMAFVMAFLTLAGAASCGGAKEQTPAEQTLEAYYLNETLVARITQVAEEPTFGIPLNNEELTLGNLGTEKVEVYIPSGAFNDGEEVALEIITDPPPVSIEGADLLGVAVRLDLKSMVRRSNLPIEVKLKFDQKIITQQGEVLVGYYHEEHGWELFTPDHVDLEQGVVGFTTYHFSLFGAMKVSDQVRVERFIEQKTLQTFLDQQIIGQSRREAATMVAAIIQDGFGIQENEIIDTMANEVIQQIADGDIADALNNPDAEPLQKRILETSIAYIVDNPAAKDGLMKSTSTSGGSEEALKAAEKLIKERENEPAGRILADHVMENLQDSSNFYIAGNWAFELAKHTRELWSNSEIQKAYRAYSQGAEAGRYGYSAEKGEWGQLLAQNPTIFEEAAAGHIRAKCQAAGLDISRLDKTALESMHAEGLSHLKNQFDERMVRETEIQTGMAGNQVIMNLLQGRGLLEQTVDNPVYMGGETDNLEDMLHRLGLVFYAVREQIGRENLVDSEAWEGADPTEQASMIPEEVMAELVFHWYADSLYYKPDVYQELIREMQKRMDKNSGWQAEEINLLVASMVDR